MKKICMELKTYLPVIEALSFARVLSIVGLTILIIGQDLFQNFKSFIEKIKLLIISIHTTL